MAFGRPVPQGLPSTPCRQQNASLCQAGGTWGHLHYSAGRAEAPGGCATAELGSGGYFYSFSCAFPAGEETLGGAEERPSGRGGRTAAAPRSGSALALTQLSLSLFPPPRLHLPLPPAPHSFFPFPPPPSPLQAERARQEAERAAARPPAARPAPPPWVGSAAWGETAPRWRRVAAGWRSRNSPVPLRRARPAREAAAAAPTAAGRRRRAASRGRCPRREAPASTASGGWRGAPPAAPWPRRCRPAAAGAPPASPLRPPRCSPPPAPAPAGPAAGRWWCRPRCAASASMCSTVTCTATSPRGAPASPMTPSEYRSTPRLPALVGASRAPGSPARAPRRPSNPSPPPPGSCPRSAPHGPRGPGPGPLAPPPRAARVRLGPAAPRPPGPRGTRRRSPRGGSRGDSGALPPPVPYVPAGAPLPALSSRWRVPGRAPSEAVRVGSAPCLSLRAAPGPLRQAGSERECSAWARVLLQHGVTVSTLRGT